jgi:ABC-type uncharacterized transport system involved in gliding motility auxiliary subunit
LQIVAKIILATVAALAMSHPIAPRIRQKIAHLGKFFLRQLHLIGAALLSMGLVMGFFSEQWWPWPTIIVALGLGAIAIGLGWRLQRQGWFAEGNRRLLWQMGFAVLAAIALNILIATYTGRIDLTENQLYTLSGQTQQVVKSLKQPLKIWVFTKNKTAVNDEILAAYRKLSPQFSFEFVDPQSALAQRFNLQAAGEVHIETGTTKKLLQSLYPGQTLTEVQLTSGIERALAPPAKIYWLQGHGEPNPQEFSQADRALRNKNYQVQPIVLAQSPLPKAAKLLVWIGSKQPLLPAELTAIDSYLADGGRLLLLANPNVQLGARDLLQKWGVTLSDRTIWSQVANRIEQVAVVTNYGTHPISQSFGNNLSIYPAARPLSFQPMADRSAVPILMTSDNSWAAPPQADRRTFDPKLDQKGPLTLGVAVTNEKSGARLVVIGNSSFIQDGGFEQGLNGDVFLNSLGWLSDQDSLNMRPKEITNRRIDLSAGQTQFLFWLPVVLLPCASWSLAGWRWWQQR